MPTKWFLADFFESQCMCLVSIAVTHSGISSRRASAKLF